MNVVAEGVAFRFFTVATEAVARVGLPLGRFWSDHGDDLAHARIGVAEIGEVEAGTDQARRLLSGADLTLALFDLAIDSWCDGAPGVNLDPGLPRVSTSRSSSVRSIELTVDG